ncbi:ABC transporter permease [Amaricoccus macauensis]|uniref:ABC transporter permease n=1 Tax=Amaricoccus macauensis TaxID=57001 RepID=UPI003C7E657E
MSSFDTFRLSPLRPRADRPSFQRLRVLSALVIREMGTSFGKSAGGYFWAIAQPLGGILLLAIAFGLALRSPPLGNSFLFFYSTGIVPLQLFLTMHRAVSSAITSNRGLLAYPVVSALDAVAAKFLLTLMTNFMIAVLLIGGIIVVSGAYVILDWEMIVISFTLVSLLGLGVGTLNCVLFGFFPTWKNIWSVLTRPLFIISGVFYVFESIPAAFQDVVWYNPVLQCIGLMRAGFFGTYNADYVSIPYVLGISLTCLVIGGYLVRRHAAFLIEQ